LKRGDDEGESREEVDGVSEERAGEKTEAGKVDDHESGPPVLSAHLVFVVYCFHHFIDFEIVSSTSVYIGDLVFDENVREGKVR
jgi:hypothetical protein